MADAAASFPPGYADQNKGPTILATCITMTSLSTIFVAARLFVRARIMGKLHLDDYLIIAAIVRVIFLLYICRIEVHFHCLILSLQ